MFLNEPKKWLCILATIVRKLVTENFKKSPNLVTLMAIIEVPSCLIHSASKRF